MILGILIAKNEADFIETMLKHNLTWLDGIVAIDNGSTDGTFEILKKHCLEVIQDSAEFDQTRLVPKLMEMSQKYKPDWYAEIDADELLIPANEVKYMLSKVPNEYNCVTVDVKKMDTGEVQFGFDRIFRGNEWDYSALRKKHSGKMPIARDKRIRWNSGFLIQHYQIRSKEQGLEKAKRHEEADPQHIYQPQGYNHLVERAMKL